jgi:hypothetical protein
MIIEVVEAATGRYTGANWSHKPSFNQKWCAWDCGNRYGNNRKNSGGLQMA